MDLSKTPFATIIQGLIGGILTRCVMSQVLLYNERDDNLYKRVIVVN